MRTRRFRRERSLGTDTFPFTPGRRTADGIIITASPDRLTLSAIMERVTLYGRDRCPYNNIGVTGRPHRYLGLKFEIVYVRRTRLEPSLHYRISIFVMNTVSSFVGRIANENKKCKDKIEISSYGFRKHVGRFDSRLGSTRLA